jgi:hypothetical protein
MYFFISKFCWKSHERNSFCERKRDNLFLFLTWNFKGWMKNAQANIRTMNLHQNTRKIYKHRSSEAWFLSSGLLMIKNIPKVSTFSFIIAMPCKPVLLLSYLESYLSDLGCWLRRGGLPLTFRRAWRCSSLTGTPRNLAQFCYMGSHTHGSIQLVIWGWPLIND